MDLLLEAASTSDVEERDLLESASSEYWGRVPRLHGASSDLDVKDTADDSMVREIHQNLPITCGCVRLRCTIGPPPSQETPFLFFRILLCSTRHPLSLHMFLSPELKTPQHQVGLVVGHQPHRQSHHSSPLPLLSLR
jgi:hypothetical protein